MGISASVSASTVVNKARNTTYQEANNACQASCSQIISGTTIVLNNTKAGNITFTQQCSAESSCYMKNALEAQVFAVQKAITDTKAQPSLFPGTSLNVSVSTSVQEIENNLTQIMNNLCTADVKQVNYGTTIYATDSTVGNIGFVQNGNAVADCVMENTGRIKVQLQQEGKATAKAGGTTALGTAIALAIIVIIIIVVASRLAKKKEGTKAEGQPCVSNTDCAGGGSCVNSVCAPKGGANAVSDGSTNNGSNAPVKNKKGFGAAKRKFQGALKAFG